MRFELTEVWGFEHALRGMRNPKNSHHKSDSCFGIDCNEENVIARIQDGAYFRKLKQDGEFFSFVSIGSNDMELAQALTIGGSEHRKFLRQIFVSVDITAPLYWWKEFDTYKIGTVANSTSTMHKISSKPITIDCFEIDDYNSSLQLIDPITLDVRAGDFIDVLEQLRQLHLKYDKLSKREGIEKSEKKRLQKISKQYWKELIRWLPSSWLQTRTLTFSYENLLAMCSKGQRRPHKLNEWSGIDDKTLENFISWARELPYAQEFIFIDEIIDS